MPWDEPTRMEQRERFIGDLDSYLFTMTELCEHYGVSRKTGYKWAERYAGGGVEGLRDRSRAPKSCACGFRPKPATQSDVNPATDSDSKAATRSGVKAATCSDVKAATFQWSSEGVAGLPSE